VKNLLPFLLVVALFVVLILVSSRNRRRAAAQNASRSERLTVGTQVMTTSGLYGTIIGRNGDDTVQLQIAPGVEVKWALAALRDADSLAPPFRQGIGGGGIGGGNMTGGGMSGGSGVDMHKRSDQDPDAAA
jgi:preprotein translocase subunit YajC